MNSRRVLITGCSSGIGRASAELLAARGHEVIATAQRPEALTDLKVARTLRLDVTDPESVERARDEAGDVDVLVNNAGRGLHAPVEFADPVLLRRLWEVNVLGPALVIRAFLPGMRAQGRGRIINVTSVAGRRAMPLVGHYAATKHAVEAMSEALRWEVHRFGIDVVMVEPGAVSTAFSRNRLGIEGDLGPYRDLAERAARWSRSVNEPAQSAEEVAAVVAEAVEADRVPLRLPTSPGVARMIADRQERSDEEFENWVLAGLGYGGEA